jgi:hypothetical protein
MATVSYAFTGSTNLKIWDAPCFFVNVTVPPCDPPYTYMETIAMSVDALAVHSVCYVPAAVVSV